MNKKHLFSLALVAVMAVAVVAPAYADNDGNNDRDNQGNGPGLGLGFKMNMMGELKDNLRVGMGMRPVLVGKVTAVSGSTITVASEGFGKDDTKATFTVNASSALVFKGNATSTVSNIAVGDTILVQGTVSGTSVVATKIFDGQMMQKIGDKIDDRGDKKATSTNPMFQGNGQPIVAGTVTAVSGSTITITNASNATFTINASGANIQIKGNASSTVSGVVVGDRLVVQGTVNGSSVVATSIFDQGKVGSNNDDNGNNGNVDNNGEHVGFFRGIGNFFRHLFGF